jgi:hypothetical protein
MTRQRKPTDPRDAHANDQDKHGRKQNSGTNHDTLRELGSRRDTGFDGADSSPRGQPQQPRKDD